MILVTSGNPNIRSSQDLVTQVKKIKNVHPLVTQPSQGGKWVRYNLSSIFSKLNTSLNGKKLLELEIEVRPSLAQLYFQTP